MNVFGDIPSADELDIPSADELERICLSHNEEPDDASFHNFPNLPPELRLMIWEYAISRPQIASLTKEDSSGIDDDIKYGRLPAFLFVNVECRDVALKMDRYPIRFTFRHCADCPDHCTSAAQHGREGVQRCLVGPEDTVALRIEKDWYPMWRKMWEWCPEALGWEAKMYNMSPFSFDGHWIGDYAKMRNWMMLVPLNAFHLDRTGNTELANLDFYRCRAIEGWLRWQFHTLLRDDRPFSGTFEGLHYVLYGWEQPKKENLTAYELESIVDCLPNLHRSVELVYDELQEQMESIFLKLKSAKILRYQQGKLPPLNLIRMGNERQ
ncbi:hypothetical protein F5Y10DRAFT_172941 [Nemania abortiva]|nr:hypothetical protein F5Y10DRAFT_172941 [Nemania abortiva]